MREHGRHADMARQGDVMGQMVHHHGLGLLGTIGIVLLALALIGALWAAHRRGLLTRGRLRQAIPARPVGTDATTSAEELLDLRLARGEIDVADYHERRSALQAARL